VDSRALDGEISVWLFFVDLFFLFVQNFKKEEI